MDQPIHNAWRAFALVTLYRPMLLSVILKAKLDIFVVWTILIYGVWMLELWVQMCGENRLLLDRTLMIWTDLYLLISWSDYSEKREVYPTHNANILRTSCVSNFLQIDNSVISLPEWPSCYVSQLTVSHKEQTDKEGCKCLGDGVAELMDASLTCPELMDLPGVVQTTRPTFLANV